MHSPRRHGFDLRRQPMLAIRPRAIVEDGVLRVEVLRIGIEPASTFVSAIGMMQRS
jgi:hypothetical protein